MSPLRWTTKSLRHLAEQLAQQGHVVSAATVGRLLLDGLSVRHAAVVERRRHQRRGAPRLPGTRGGVFRQKITDAEQILATILHLRQVCTMQALAELFDVSRRTIGNALAEVRPLLETDGFHLPPAPSRLRSATDLLTSITRKTKRRPTPNHHVESIQALCHQQRCSAVSEITSRILIRHIRGMRSSSLSARRPAHRWGDSDRGCPPDTGVVRPMWHAGGAAGKDSHLSASASARVQGEARPRRPLASLARARRARGRFRTRPSPSRFALARMRHHQAPNASKAS
jgi:hypothetical protein